MLNTLGSMRILCPVPEFPCLDCELSIVTALCRDLDTKPGTEVWRISSNSSCSAFISVFRPISDNLNIF